MRVLFIAHYNGFYGANKSLLQLILELRLNHGITPTVFVLKGDGIFSGELEKNEIDYKIVPYYNWLNRNSFFKALIKKICNIFFLQKIVSGLKEKEFDLIHTNSSATDLGAQISIKLKIPHIWHIREYGKKDYNLNYLGGYRVAGRFMERNSSVVIAISQDIKNYYSKFIDPKKIKVIHNGIKKIPNLERNYFSNNLLNICILGLISENKNQIEAIKACEILLKKNYENKFVLNIVGDGNIQELLNIKKYVNDNNLEGHIKFINYQYDISEFLKTIDLGIVPSKSEAFGRVTVEYMMHKIPVVAADAGANKEIISSEKVGFVYELGNYEKLATQIERFILNKEEIKFMGINCYEHALHNFSSRQNSDTIFNSYLNVIHK